MNERNEPDSEHGETCIHMQCPKCKIFYWTTPKTGTHSPCRCFGEERRGIIVKGTIKEEGIKNAIAH